MRPIESQEIIEKRRKRNQLVIGIILIGIMVLSSAGYALINSFSGQAQQATTQDKYGLVYDGSFWMGNLSGNIVSFTVDPDEAKNISVDLGNISINSYAGQGVYVVTNGDAFSFNQIAANLAPFVGNVREGCLGKCDKDLPEKSCNDYLIVINNTSEDNRVYTKNKCIFVDGNSDVTEAMLYHILGIIP